MIRASSLAIASSLLLASSPPTHARTLELLLGDANTAYNGAGSVDDVYVDPAWVGALVLANWPGPFSDFDQSRVDHNVPFTFLFPLQPGEIVAAATLTLSVRSTHADVFTDEILIDSASGADSYTYSALGWLPLPNTGTHLRTMDLATALGRNALPHLQDGQLNVLIRDDTFVNYAILDLRITSLPGDANANDLIDPDDFALTDRGFRKQLTGWQNGDFNADGLVDATDYLLLDTSYAAQLSAPLAPDFLAMRESLFGPAYVQQLLSSIPEPATLAPLLLTLYCLSPRRNRPRRRRLTG